MKKSTFTSILLIAGIIIGIIILIVISTRSSRDQGDDPARDNIENLLIQDARVDDIEIRIQESFPVGVQVAAYGNLPDTCTTIRESVVDYIDSIFTVTITTQRERDAICGMMLQPFEERIMLPVENLPRGEYLVSVNGVSKTFPL